MSGLDPIKTLQFRIYFRNQHFFRPRVQKLLDELDCIREVMAIEVGLIALVFQDENGHPDDPMALPDSTS